MSVKGKKKHDGMKNHLGPKKEQNKFKNYGWPKCPKGGCYLCRKTGHYARDCMHNKSKNKVNIVQAGDNIIYIVIEIMEIKGNVQGWWYATCVNVHVSYDKTSFKTHYEVTNEQEIQMENRG